MPITKAVTLCVVECKSIPAGDVFFFKRGHNRTCGILLMERVVCHMFYIASTRNMDYEYSLEYG